VGGFFFLVLYPETASLQYTVFCKQRNKIEIKIVIMEMKKTYAKYLNHDKVHNI